MRPLGKRAVARALSSFLRASAFSSSAQCHITSYFQGSLTMPPEREVTFKAKPVFVLASEVREQGGFLTCLGPVGHLWVLSLQGNLSSYVTEVFKDMVYFSAHKCQGFSCAEDNVIPGCMGAS